MSIQSKPIDMSQLMPASNMFVSPQQYRDLVKGKRQDPISEQQNNNVVETVIKVEEPMKNVVSMISDLKNPPEQNQYLNVLKIIVSAYEMKSDSILESAILEAKKLLK